MRLLLVWALFQSAAVFAQTGAARLGSPRVTAASGSSGAEPSDVAQNEPQSDARESEVVVLAPVPPPPSEGTRLDPAQFSLDDGPQVPSRIATRLRVLDADLAALAARGNSNLVDGILSLVGGGVVGGLGIWALDSNRFLGTYLLLYGGASLLRGVIDLAVSPNASDAHIEFAHFPTGTTADLERKLQLGEEILERLARRTKIARILDASLNIAVGIAIVPIYLAPNDYEIVSPFDYVVLIGSGLSVLGGIVSLLSRSDAERRYQAYLGLREQLAGPSISGVVLPLPGGAMGAIRGTF